jgi:hypothetical protein
MRTANNKYYGILALSVAGALVLTAMPSARAQGVTDLAVAASATSMAAAASPVPMPPPGAEKVGSASNLANPPGGPGVGAPVATKATLPAVVADDDLPEDSKKIPTQVTAVVKKLQEAKVDLSLEDMNQARAALARLDLLLELEQKMTDLDKARAKHAGADMADDVSAMLPRGVTRMPTRGAMAVDVPVVTPVAMRAPIAATYSVLRINGIDGSYSAQLSSAMDEKTTVHVGDKLSDGSTVTGITASTVSVRGANDKTDHMLRVNNTSPMNHGRRAP